MNETLEMFQLQQGALTVALRANPEPQGVLRIVKGQMAVQGDSTNRAFDGETYDPALDKSRLTRQLDRVRELMSDGRWRTLAEIAEAVGCSEGSGHARLRDLRKPRFGLYTVRRKRIGKGLYCYQLGERGI